MQETPVKERVRYHEKKTWKWGFRLREKYKNWGPWEKNWETALLSCLHNRILHEHRYGALPNT